MGTSLLFDDEGVVSGSLEGYGALERIINDFKATIVVVREAVDALGVAAMTRASSSSEDEGDSEDET